ADRAGTLTIIGVLRPGSGLVPFAGRNSYRPGMESHTMERSSARRLALGCASLAALIAVLALVAGSAVAKQLPAKDRKFVDGVVAKAMEGERLPGVSVTVSGP